MKWYHLVACFFAGICLANAVPHYVNGISGDAFPTPFANPPGAGLSPPVVNVLWALINIAIGYVLISWESFLKRINGRLLSSLQVWY